MTGSADGASGLVPVGATLPVAKVTLFEDRAHVLRRGRVALPAGSIVLQLSGVAPVVADRTLRCRVLTGPAGAKVVEARMRRLKVILAAERPEEVRERTRQLEALTRELAATDARIEALRHDLAAFKEARTQALGEIAVDAAWGRGDAASWRPHLELIGERDAAARTQLAAESIAREGLARRHADLTALIAARARPDDVMTTTLEIQLDVPEAGEAELECAYTVPGACWRPAHTARLVGAKLAWQAEGVVWQSTGEDWTDVSLAFSTQRLSRGIEPPPLAADVIGVQAKAAQLVVETREQEIATAGLGSVQTTSQVPGIDDGGETRHLESPATASVPSDGRPHRVPLFAFEASAAMTRVAMAELSDAVHLRTEQVNEGKQPLLAGPVDLIRESGYVGITGLPFIAAGERFPLGWGPDAGLRLRRRHDQVEEKTTMLNALSAWTVTDHRVELKLSNIGEEPCTIEVTERVPVSEVDKVKVEPEAKNTTHGLLPDRDGFVRWTVSLAANENSKIKLHYRMKRHRDVVSS